MGSDKTAAATARARKSGARELDEFPRPSVAVDVVVLTVEPRAAELSVLLVRRPTGDLALPGTFLHGGATGAPHERETLAEAVSRCLRDKAGVSHARPEQLFVFDNPNRDERGWVLSVAHLAVVPFHLLDSQRNTDRTELLPLSRLPRLPWEHQPIVEKGVAVLRARYMTHADPDHLIADRFTIRELQQVHDAVAGRPWPRMKFRRHMVEPQRLASTGEAISGPAGGAPAELFERASTRP